VKTTLFVIIIAVLSACGGPTANSSETIKVNADTVSPTERQSQGDKNINVASIPAKAVTGESSDSGAKSRTASIEKTDNQVQTRGLVVSSERPDEKPVFKDQFLEMQVFARRKSSTPFPIQLGQNLQTGDRVFLKVHTSKSAYIYVAYVRPDGQAELVFPSEQEEHQMTAAGAEVRIPSTGKTFEITDTDTVGVENFLVIGANHKLQDINEEVGKGIERMKQQQRLILDTSAEPSEKQVAGRNKSDTVPIDATAAKLKNAQRPIHSDQKQKSRISKKYRLGMTARGFKLKDDEPSDDASEQPDENMAIIPFWLKHDSKSE
jgi:hypothetical protein